MKTMPPPSTVPARPRAYHVVLPSFWQGGRALALPHEGYVALYDEWKHHGRHVIEYAAEFVVMTALAFAVIVLVGLNFGTSSPLPGLLPHPVRLFLTGIELGAWTWLLAMSPAGKRSGAHLNPASSFGFCLLGKMQWRDLAGYVTAQMMGAVAGAALGALVAGPLARETSDAALSPGPGVGPLATGGVELLATFTLTFVVYTFLSHPRLLRFTPVAAGLTLGTLILLVAGITGAGMNPARWFGPALIARHWSIFAAYLLAPPAGAALAVLARRTGVLFSAVPHTAKIVHDHRYPSIFLQDRVHTTPPRGVCRSAEATVVSRLSGG